MKVYRDIADIKARIKSERSSGKSVGLVPTMGFLHDGHLSLVSKSVADNDLTAVSIFVNPTQFAAGEDLDSYPQDFDKDCELLTQAGADIVFAPTPAVMYPEGEATRVYVSGSLVENLCGNSRPGHFEGVTTVVMKLFNIIQADNAYFGMKDYQQLAVLKRMAKDMNLDVNVIGMPIVREEDGLAMSSRNVYLTDDERESALSLSKSFEVIQNMLNEGIRDAEALKIGAEDFISSYPHTQIDYIEIADTETLEPVGSVQDKFLYALAVKVGKARLIDNNIFEVR